MKNFVADLKTEFAGYNAGKLTKDLMAGITVAAVALPLALAFGVSSGADAAAGMVTAVIAGIVIGALSGASFQISGPTGAMAAILVSIVAQYGLNGVFLASLIAGILLLVCGIFKVGRLIAILPRAVITGFTSGIAIIIAMGQLDNFFGATSSGSSTLGKFISYFTVGFSPDWHTVLLGVIVIVIMLIWPKKLNQYLPSSLAALIIVLVANTLLKFDVATVGAIPKSLLLPERLHLGAVSLEMVQGLLIPAISIAALGMIESLLCGTSAAKMKDEKFDANRELVAQGIGNIIIPFFGGVPATAAIARTSVAIKAGGVTRMTGIIHALVLLASMFLLGPIMSQIPLSALAGVLIVTAWRMNDWESIRYFFSHRFKSAMIKFSLTMAATVVFDLTVAIFLGLFASVLIFVYNSSKAEVGISDIKADKLKERGIVLEEEHRSTKICYITGPIFFGTANQIQPELMKTVGVKELLLSLRGVSQIDTSGIQMILEVIEAVQAAGGQVMLCGVQRAVLSKMERGGVIDAVGGDHVYWGVDTALAHLEDSL